MKEKLYQKLFSLFKAVDFIQVFPIHFYLWSLSRQRKCSREKSLIRVPLEKTVSLLVARHWPPKIRRRDLLRENVPEHF